MGVKPVLHIAIISAHSLLSLQEVESTAGKTWSQAESSWLRASVPVFVLFLFGDPQDPQGIFLWSQVLESCVPLRQRLVVGVCTLRLLSGPPLSTLKEDARIRDLFV